MTIQQYAEKLVRTFAERGLTFGTAESCTGGLCAATVVDIPGASAVFYGGIVSYDNSVKMHLLGVPENLLGSVGAVSKDCAEAMARGARERLGVDIAVSVTGIAGPGGGTPEKPVGLVYIGCATASGVKVSAFRFGSRKRAQIRRMSVSEMLHIAVCAADPNEE
ncbi:MAG: nicotinamide-nucleotide amidohydrolase family protein [Clostridia bacterium]|nr:nicotinamide-nucleotide amidohydrolase family protein [Clostridia bacterium]